MEQAQANRRDAKDLARRVDSEPGLLVPVAFDLYSGSMLARANAARIMRFVSRRSPGLLVPFAGDLVDALDSSSRRVRTDAMRALEAIASVVPEAVSEGAGEVAVSLHDPASAHVRRGAFRVLATLVGECPDHAPVVWPWLDEALRVHHGDTAYPALLEAATGEALEVAPREARARLALLARLDAEDSRPAVRRIAERLLQFVDER